MTKPTNQSEQIADMMNRVEDTRALLDTATGALRDADQATAEMYAAVTVQARACHTLFLARTQYRDNPTPEMLRAIREAHDLWAEAVRAKVEADIVRDRALLVQQMFTDPWSEDAGTAAKDDR